MRLLRLQITDIYFRERCSCQEGCYGKLIFRTDKYNGRVAHIALALQPGRGWGEVIIQGHFV